MFSCEYCEHFKNKFFIKQLSQNNSQPATTCPKLTIETLEQGVKYVQS